MRPSRPRFYISSSERAPQDVNAMLTAIEENPNGELAYPTFAGLQRALHKDKLSERDPRSINNFLRELRETDMASLARASRARFDPTALDGFDYRQVGRPYQEMMDKINSHPTLNELSLEGLFEYVTRSVKSPDAVRRVLLFDRNVKDQFKTYTYRTRVQRKGLESSPKPKRVRRKDRPTSTKITLKPETQTNPQIEVINPPENFKAPEHEITQDNLYITQSLLGIDPGNRTYQYPDHLDLARYMQDTQGISIEQAIKRIETTILRVPRAYDLAISLRKLNGCLPDDSPNIDHLLNYLYSYQIRFKGELFHPYRRIDSGTLQDVLSRFISPTERLARSENRLIEN